jgi:predicted metal-dependent peptidase
MTRIEKQKIRVVLDHPFFGSLLMRLIVEETESIPTMSTDGEYLWINPKFADSLPDDQLRAVLVHETMHPALGHNWRVKGMGQQIANEAADIIVNGMIEQYNKDNGNPFPLPAGCVRDASLENQSLEEVYRVLLGRKHPGGQPGDKPEDNGKDKSEDKSEDKSDSGGSDSGDSGSDSDSDSDSGDSDGSDSGKPDSDGSGKPGPKTTKTNSTTPTGDFQSREDKPGDEPGTREQDWASSVVQAAITAQQMGKGSAFAKRFVAESIKPTDTPWQELLRAYLQEIAQNDYDWQRPDRRFIGSGLYLPSMHSDDAAGEVVFAVDTSGSINDKLLREFIAEGQEIMETLRPKRMHVVYCDAAINRVDVYEHGDPLVANPCGGGGTDFRPVFNYVREHVQDCKVVVYLTDLMGCFPYTDPGVPTVWVKYGAWTGRAPFGTVVEAKW